MTSAGSRPPRRAPGSFHLADWLALAAAPAFALMALLTALDGGDHAAALCSHSGQGSPMAGMMPMYVLMAAVQLAPWLRLTNRQG